MGDKHKHHVDISIHNPKNSVTMIERVSIRLNDSE